MAERNENLLAGMIAARAERSPDLDVLTFEHLSLDGGATADEVRTYADLQTNANTLAAELIRRGLGRGDRFALMLRNHPEFVEAMIAASISATACVPIDPRTRGEKLAYMLRNSGCKGVICGDYCLEQVVAVRDQLDGCEWVLALESGDAGVPSLADFAAVDALGEAISKPAGTVDLRLESDTDLLQIIYTSGTTGDPKGVVFPNNRFAGYAILGHIFGYQPDERPYTGLSLTHGNAQAVTLGPSLALGLRAVFSRRFTKSKIWDVCRAHGCTTFSLLGGMSTAIYSEPLRDDDGDNPVRFVVSAGMPSAIWESFEKRFGVDVFEWYGAVEGGIAIKPVGQGPIGSFGKGIAGLDMRILDEKDQECPPGVSGEICSRPAGGGEASVEYHDNQEASAKKTRGGWLRSGDIGHTDEEGWLHFDYRKGGGIRRNGDFINAGFVEKVIAEQDSVSDVFVYGVPAASGAPGEKDVVAALVPANRANFSAGALFARCREGLESNFVPSYLQVVDEIPKTASEKPQERFLLAEFAPDAENVFMEDSRG
ncbi:MAG: AMP-binding protein [Deltaproteobacteria bacterium]|nr:AMP-binding protein [Deltaproteobacteria bacterium]MBW2418319.1 AMP-binding protein [Deltaproteobacteria bacterium]